MLVVDQVDQVPTEVVVASYPEVAIVFFATTDDRSYIGVGIG